MRALQAEQQSAVRAAGIIDAVAVGDQATAQAADIEQRIPIRAVAGETRDVDGQDQADLAEPDASDQLLEAAALRRRRPAEPEVGIDDVDVSLVPSEFARALPQVRTAAAGSPGCSPPDEASTDGYRRPPFAPGAPA